MCIKEIGDIIKDASCGIRVLLEMQLRDRSARALIDNGGITLPILVRFAKTSQIPEYLGNSFYLKKKRVKPSGNKKIDLGLPSLAKLGLGISLTPISELRLRENSQD